jgi:hypothetical protein
MIIDIPIQNPIRQLNKGDLKGSIKETFNVDLSIKPDKICLPTKSLINRTDTDLTGLGLITDFIFHDGYYYALSAGQDSGTYDGVAQVYRGGDAVDDSFSLPTWTVNTNDFEADATAISFDGNFIYHAGDTWSLGSGADTSWTAESTTSGAGFSIAFNGRVYFFTNSQLIASYTDPATVATSGSYTFRIPTSSNLKPTGLDKTSSQIWIATTNDEGGKASVFSWDGVTENVYDGEYEIADSAIMAIRVKDNIPYIVTGSGLVMAFNGSYFEEVARFPFADIPLSGKTRPEVDLFSSALGKWMHNKGIDIIGNKLHFLINPVPEDLDPRYGDSQKLAGIWCLDDEVGLYHRFALSSTDTNGEQAIVKNVGALRDAAVEQSVNTGEFGSFLFSFSYMTEDSLDTEKYAIGFVEIESDPSVKSTGFITTNRIYAQNIRDTWEKALTGFEELESTDSIIVKYRTIEREANDVGIVWVDGTSYTSTDTNFADIKTNFDTGTSYESRILYGDGAGVISQITAITEASGTYTITVDTSHFQTPTNTAVARIENWTVGSTITSADNEAQFVETPIAKESNWIQYKLVLNGTEIAKNKHNPVINRFVSVSNQHTKFQ